MGEGRGDGGMMTAWGIAIPTKGQCSGAFLLRLLCVPDLQCRYPVLKRPPGASKTTAVSSVEGRVGSEVGRVLRALGDTERWGGDKGASLGSTSHNAVSGCYNTHNKPGHRCTNSAQQSRRRKHTSLNVVDSSP